MYIIEYKNENQIPSETKHIENTFSSWNKNLQRFWQIRCLCLCATELNSHWHEWTVADVFCFCCLWKRWKVTRDLFIIQFCQKETTQWWHWHQQMRMCTLYYVLYMWSVVLPKSAKQMWQTVRFSSSCTLQTIQQTVWKWQTTNRFKSECEHTKEKHWENSFTQRFILHNET